MIRVSLIALLAFCNYVEGRSKTSLNFEVKQVEGAVYVWEPWSDRWDRLSEGRTLVPGTLLQVTRGGRAHVSIPSFAGPTRQAGNSIVKFTAPSIVRLEEGFLRKIHLSSYFVPMLKTPPVKDEDEKEGVGLKPMVHTLDEAYQRFVAVLAKFDVKALMNQPPRVITAEKSGETEWVSKLRPIRIYHPQDKSIIVADRLPTSVKVMWRPVAADAPEYDVYLWPAEEARKKPVATTSFDFYTLDVKAEGRYYIQIATRDGNFQSAAHALHIALPLTLTSTTPPLPKPGEDPSSGILRPNLSFPVKRFAHVVSNLPATVTFQWESPQDKGVGEARDTIVILDSLGRERMRKVTRSGTLPLAFAQAEEFQWYIERKASLGTETKTVKSETRTFRIIKRDPTKPSWNLLTAKSPGVFYIEDF